jgi:xanthine dehydrogenase YagS FAD-binding subunit
MKPFEYAAPVTLGAASELLSDTWGRSEVLAGGTDLITALKQGITTPTRVVSLRNIGGLRRITEERGLVRVGAMTSLGELAGDPTVRRLFPSVVTAALSVGSPQILSVGTVGGDLCQRPRCWYFRNGFGLLARQGDTSLVREGDNRYHAIFATTGPALFVSASSLGPALVALGAGVTVSGPGEKTRVIPVAEFFRAPAAEGERETALRPNEIVSEIHIPISGLKNATYEVRHRHGLDWPYVTASIAYRAGAAATQARIVLGHVAATPWVSNAAATALNGAIVDETTARKCGEAAVEGAQPLSGNVYKLQMVKAAVSRAVLAASAA